MMDFGYLGSASNLSPLAPPFTFDRSNAKPNAESLVHFNEPQPAVPYSSSLCSWQYSPSSAPNPNFYSNSNVDSGVDSIRTTYVASENYYPYYGTNTQMPTLNPNISTTPDAFTFPQYSSETSTHHDESKTYGQSFVSPVADDDISAVVFHKPNYNFSSTSAIPHVDGTSQIDYHQSLSGLNYMPQWGTQWDTIERLADREMGERVNFDGNFCSMQTDDVGPYDAYKYSPNQGTCKAEGFGIGKETSAVSHGTCLNLLGGETQIFSQSTGGSNGKPFSVQGPRFTPYESAKTSGLSKLPKSHAKEPSVEATTTYLNHQKPYASYGQSFQPFSASKIGSVSAKRSSPALVIRPPSVGSKLPFEKVDHLCDSSTSNRKGELHNKPFSEEIEAHFSIVGKEIGSASDGRSSPSLVIKPSVGPKLGLEKNDHSCDSSSSNIKGGLPAKPLVEYGEDHVSKAGMKLELPDMNVPPNSFSPAADEAKAVASVEGPFESADRNYTALDSPCWKGVSSFRFSPYEYSVSATSENLLKISESFGGLKYPQSQFLAPFSEDSAKDSSPNQHENSVDKGNGYVELGSLLCPDRLSGNPSKEYSSTHEAGVDYSKISSINAISLSDVDKLEKDDDSKQLDSEKGGFVPGSSVAEIKLNCNATFPKLDIQKLIAVIHNLSELLLSQCRNDASAVLGPDYEALKHVIENLDACVPKKVVHSPIQESIVSEEGICHICTKLPDLHEGDRSGRPPVTKEAIDGSCPRFDLHSSQQGLKNSELSGKEFSNLTDLLSANVDVDIVKDDKVAQAMEKVLKDNFSAEEETQPEILLYRNLWLEAEAALCSINFRARYDRMKIEMEKLKLARTNDVAPTMNTIVKLPSEVCSDSSITRQGNPSQDFSTPRTTEEVGEASVEARLHILANRLPNQNSVDVEEQTDEEADATFAGVEETIEKLLSSVDSEDSAMSNIAQKVAHVKDCTVPDKSIHDFTSSSRSQITSDVDSSVMARFHILKNRGLDENSENLGQQSEHVVNSEFAGKRYPLRFSELLAEDNFVSGPFSQYSKVSRHKPLISDFHVCASDARLSQLGGIRLGTQLSSGWGDSSLSDWEDVLKDEVASQK